MEYSWKVNVVKGLGKWKTVFTLYYTSSCYSRNVTSVPTSWTESARETISLGKSYQWKVELYDPNGTLVDAKWSEAPELWTLRFNVLHDDSAYEVLLYPPFSAYNRSLQYIRRDVLQSWYVSQY